MRALIQRVTRAEVRIDGETAGRCGTGLLILLGIGLEDTLKKAETLARRCAELRIFEDDAGKMNRSLLDIHGSALVISQFTLYGDAAQGRRPFFGAAARPELAIPCYERFVEALRSHGIPVETGRFGADMKVELVNDGPVTLMLESKACE